MKVRRRPFLAMSSLAALAGCGGGTWLGESEPPPLPGERRAVLLLEDAVAADPRLATLNVELPPPVRNADWPQSGGNPRHAMGHLEAADTIDLAWRAGIGTGSGGGTRLIATPIMADGRVFAVDADGEASAYNAADGEALWRFAPEGVDELDRLRAGAPAYADGRLFVAGAEGTVLAVDPAEGRELWRQSLRAPIRAAPTVINGKLLVPTADSQLFALDAATGEVQWRHAGLFEQAGILGGASPAATDDIVIAAYASGEVVALTLDAGQPLWGETVLRPRRTLAIGAITDIVGDPVIDGNRVVVAGASGEMAAFDLLDGRREWTADVTSTQTPWVAGEFIYALTERNELVCLLRQGGRIRWVGPLGELVDPDDPESARVRWAGPILVSDRLLMGSSQGEVVSVSPYTGEVLGRTSLPGPVTLPPIVADGTVYFLTDGGVLLAYR
jgi:outer membrane protein assembly factor BamB